MKRSPCFDAEISTQTHRLRFLKVLAHGFIQRIPMSCVLHDLHGARGVKPSIGEPHFRKPTKWQCFQRKTLENDDHLEFGTSKALAPDLVNNFTLGFSMKETIPAIGFAIKHHPFIVDSSIIDHPAIDAIGVPLCEEPHPRCPAHLVPPVHGVAPTCYITVGRARHGSGWGERAL